MSGTRPDDRAGSDWSAQKEQSAGWLRMRLMWWIYRVFGKNAQKLAFLPAMPFIYPFCAPARRALRSFYAVLGRKATHRRMYSHLLGFAFSLMDKTDACTLKKNLPRMTVRDDDGWRAFKELTDARRGAFLMSTHVGTIEVLPALAARLEEGGGTSGRPRIPFVHAFQQMGHDSVFTSVFMRHFDASSLALHAVEDIGVETACEMKDALSRGELVLMAGDRLAAGYARTRNGGASRREANALTHPFLGRQCRWPKGVFVFARLMEAPVFFVSCVRTGWNAYEARFERFAGDPRDTSALLAAYVGFLSREVADHPEQWYHFHDFFDV